MPQDKFQIGEMYFIGGYHDPQRTYPCVIRPVVYLGIRSKRKKLKGEEDFETYVFEELEAWLARKGKGRPARKNIRCVEGPSDMTLVMDIDRLVDDLMRLQRKLRK